MGDFIHSRWTKKRELDCSPNFCPIFASMALVCNSCSADKILMWTMLNALFLKVSPTSSLVCSAQYLPWQCRFCFTAYEWWCARNIMYSIFFLGNKVLYKLCSIITSLRYFWSMGLTSNRLVCLMTSGVQFLVTSYL